MIVCVDVMMAEDVRQRWGSYMKEMNQTFLRAGENTLGDVECGVE